MSGLFFSTGSIWRRLLRRHPKETLAFQWFPQRGSGTAVASQHSKILLCLEAERVNFQADAQAACSPGEVVFLAPFLADAFAFTPLAMADALALTSWKLF